MGSSYRSDLNNGMMPSWENKLKSAIVTIEDIADELGGLIGDDGQFDNAADDGALRERLLDASEIIRRELPMTKGQIEIRIKMLQRKLAEIEKS